MTARRLGFHTSLTAMLLFAAFLPAAAQEAPPSKVPAAVEQIVKTLHEMSARQDTTDPSTLSTRIVHVNPGGEVELLFHARQPVGEAEIAQLRGLGATIVGVLNFPAPMIQAWVPFGLVDAAAALPWVAAVTPPGYGETNTHPNNPINSEGVALHRADVAQAQGFNGAGVTVGVISNGVSNLAAAQARNELPAVTVLLTGNGDEGTAMLEIVHDMAQGAALVFNANGGGTMGHVTAVQNLVNAGVNVIAEDLAFDSEPAFQRGVVATARENAAAGGVSVHSSSGNRGQNHSARVQAVGTGAGPDGFNGPFTNCPVNPTNAVAIAPGGDTTFDIVLGASGTNGTSITLQWSEPRSIFPTAGAGGFTNLDLFVMNAAGNTCLASSTAVQGGGAGDTIEQVTLPAAMAGTAAKIVVNVTGVNGAAATPTLDLRWRNTQSQTDTPTRAGSNDPDKNYTGQAFVIGAVTTAGALEGFSSAGPVNLVLTTVCPNNNYPCANGVAGPAAQQFQGLDFLGADGVQVSGVGTFGSGTCPAVNPGDCRFFGTSAAAPHTAGCDAIVRQLLGAATAPATIRARLASTAVDVPPPGEDSTTGAGRLDCFAALRPPKAVCQNRTVNTDPGQCTASNVSVDNGSFDTGGGAITLAQAPPNPYALGATMVTLTATDSDNLNDSCQAVVTVLDKEKPVLSNVPAPISVEQTALAGTPVVVPLPTATDNCGGPLPVSSDAPAVFPLGTTTVTFTATDGSSNTATATTTVTVVDTTPPVINAVTASPASLFPPRHDLVPVSISVDVVDICDATPACQIISVTSDEPLNGLGDGNTNVDWELTGDLSVNIRAERSGRDDGRVYTLTVRCTDDSGNASTKSVTVTVAHDQR